MNALMQLKDLAKLPKFLDCSGFSPRHVDLLLSSKCNLKCQMCNVWKLSTKNSDKLSELSTEKIMSFLEEAAALGTKYLCISGGEPTLRGDLLTVIEKAKKEDMNVNLITNGTLITDELAEKLVSLGLDEIVFSVDSSTPMAHDTIRGVNGTYKKAVKGLKAVKSARAKTRLGKPRVIVNYAVSRLTYEFIEEIIDLRSELGFDELLFLPLNPKTARSSDLLLTDDDIKKLWSLIPSIKSRLERNGLAPITISPLVYICRNREASVQGRYSVPARSKIMCFQPWQLATVDPFGNVYPCCFACTFQNLKDENINDILAEDNFNMGNIKEKSFKEIWNGQKYKWFRNKVKQPLAFEMCYSCNYSVRRDMFLTGIFAKPQMLLRYINELVRTSYDQTQVTNFLT